MWIGYQFQKNNNQIIRQRSKVDDFQTKYSKFEDDAYYSKFEPRNGASIADNDLRSKSVKNSQVSIASSFGGIKGQSYNEDVRRFWRSAL